jgi:outer membrane protein assembly factor BamB
VISGYSTPTIWRPKDGPAQILIPESFQLTAYSMVDGKQLWYVRGLACEMKSVASIDGDTLYVNGWGFGQNQAGTQIPTVDFKTGLQRFDKNGDGFVGRDEVANPTGTDRMDRMLRPEAGFDAFDGNRDGKLDARDWEVFRAMLAAENGLMAIKLGGSGDMTATAVKWKYLRPVPQVPSTVLYQGVLYMVNDSGILLSFDPKTGDVLKQGRLKGAIDKYFASPIGVDGKIWLASQDGTISIVTAKGDWEMVQVNTLDDEVFATPVPADGELFVRTRSALYNFVTEKR